MSDTTNKTGNNQDSAEKEMRVLKAMKQTLTCIIKDTTTKPGLKHPLSELTREDIRQCLMLLSAREQELLAGSNATADMRPGFIDEPADAVVVPISDIKIRKKDK